MIEYRVGNLFDTNIRFIGHGCNCMGRMGSGVAKIVKEQYPKAYEDYKKACNMAATNPAALLGMMVAVDTEDQKTILNMFTQKEYGTDKRHVDYEAVYKVFDFLNTFFKGYPEHERYVAIPKIGAGLAGGNWKIISTIIEECSVEYQTVVYVLDDSEIP